MTAYFLGHIVFVVFGLIFVYDSLTIVGARTLAEVPEKCRNGTALIVTLACCRRRPSAITPSPRCPTPPASSAFRRSSSRGSAERVRTCRILAPPGLSRAGWPRSAAGRTCCSSGLPFWWISSMDADSPAAGREPVDRSASGVRGLRFRDDRPAAPAVEGHLWPVPAHSAGKRLPPAATRIHSASALFEPPWMVHLDPDLRALRGGTRLGQRRTGKVLSPLGRSPWPRKSRSSDRCPATGGIVRASAFDR